MEILRCAKGENPHRPGWPVPSIIWVVSVTNEAQRDILQPKFEKYLGPNDVAKIRHRQRGVWDQVILRNGSLLGFKSVEMGRTALQGAAIHGAAFDEEPPKDIYDEVRTRLTDYRGDLWITMTPVNGMTWTFDEFVDEEHKDPDSKIFTASMWDNARSRGGYIADDEVRRYEESISDPIMRRIRVYGEYHNQSGRVYKEFDRKTHLLKELPPEFRNEAGTLNSNFDFYCTIDTGRCFAAGFYLVDYFGNIVKFDEYYAEDRPIGEHARKITNLCNTYGIWPEFSIDPTSQFFTDLAEHGIVCLHGDHDVEKGIGAMQEYLHYNPAKQLGLKYGNPRWYIVREKCPRTLHEIQRYQWEAPAKSGGAMGEKKNKPLKKDDHQMDCDRYMAVKRPDAAKPPNADADTRPDEMRIRDRVKEKIKAHAAGRDTHNATQNMFGLDDY